MKATINGITYEGTEEEIRRIVENPPTRPSVEIRCYPTAAVQRNNEGNTTAEWNNH